VVAAVDVALEVYELLEQVDQLRQRTQTQGAAIGLLATLRGGKLDADRVPDGETKSYALQVVETPIRFPTEQ